MEDLCTESLIHSTIHKYEIPTIFTLYLKIIFLIQLLNDEPQRKT